MILTINVILSDFLFRLIEEIHFKTKWCYRLFGLHL